MVGGKFKEAHPEYSAKKLAEAIGITEKGIEKQLAKLKAEGFIRREGPDKGGDLLLGPFPSKTNIFLKYPKSFARKAVSLQDGYGPAGFKEQIRYHRQ